MLNSLADDFFTSGLFRLRLFSLLFWVITFTGLFAGVCHGRHIGGRLSALKWGAIGIGVGFTVSCVFIMLCLLLFRLFLRWGWVAPPERRSKGEER